MQNLLAIVAQAAKLGARPITVTMRTVPKLAKRCPFKGITKRSKVNAFLGAQYERSVNRQRTREGSKANFRTESTWFTHTDVPSVVVGKRSGKLYLQLKVQRVLSEQYIDEAGNAYSRADLAAYLPEHSKSAKQGLARSVLTIVPAFDSILSLTVNGKTYGEKPCID